MDKTVFEAVNEARREVFHDLIFRCVGEIRNILSPKNKLKMRQKKYHEEKLIPGRFYSKEDRKKKMLVLKKLKKIRNKTN